MTWSQKVTAMLPVPEEELLTKLKWIGEDYDKICGNPGTMTTSRSNARSRE